MTPATRWRAVAVAALVAVAVTVSRPDPPAATAAGTSRQQALEVEVEVLGVERSENYTELLVEIHNPTDGTLASLGLTDPAFGRIDDVVYNDLSGLRLLDPAAGIEYLPYWDQESKSCICSRFRSIDADATWQAWWRSGALPETVTTVDVLGPDGTVLAGGVEVAS